MEKLLYTFPELIKLTGLSRQVLKSWIDDGELTWINGSPQGCTRPRKRFHIDDINKCLNRRRSKAAAPRTAKKKEVLSFKKYSV